MLSRFTFGLFACFALISCSKEIAPEAKTIADYVNPFIGTGGHGHTYPGATTPFGMVQLSPDTRLEGWDGCSGYHFTDSVVYGFSHTHLSGTGVSDYGDILLMPNTGPVQFNNGYPDSVESGYASSFSKKSEKATPGYYAVHLRDYSIGVELTAAPRVGMHRYTFPEGDGHVIIDLGHRDKVLDFELLQSGPDEISGYRVSQSWADEQHVYFVAQFSQPIREVEWNENGQVAAVHFQSPDTLMVKVGISAVSVENARQNAAAEVPHWKFNQVRTQARKSWEEHLGKIEVSGGSEDKRITFYTALYHTMLAPNVFSDVNGEYRGMDGKVHHADHPVYTVFSLWDTFRALHPLFTIIERERTADFLRTFLLHYEQGGRLPVWELAGNETDCMIGYHSIPVVVDAWVKGIRDFDEHAMLKAMLDVSTMPHFGLESYMKHGAILAADEPESVSKTLEYAYDDWCIAQFAKDLGDTASWQTYSERAQYYKNLFDPDTRFFRARMDGGWFGPFDPAEVNYNYTEANAWHYALFVPHDIEGLIALHVGEAELEAHLDKMFNAPSETTGRDQADITGLIGQYAHGNEPSHHMAYLYNYTGQPWKTQQRVRQIMDELYTIHPDGLSGNEDCGQMSAWYVFSAMGFYPVTPGSPEYALGSPLFDHIAIHLENERTFNITVKNQAPENTYVQEVKLHGRDWPYHYLRHDDIMAGGEMQFTMGATPNTQRGNAPEFRLVSAIDGPTIAPLPYFLSESSTFTDSIKVALGCADSLANLFIRMGNGEFFRYEKPIVLDRTTRLEAWSMMPKGNVSKKIENTWHKIDGRRNITLGMSFANQYSAGGDGALIDYLRGSNNYRTGRWQGYQGQDFEVVLDLGEVQSVKKVAVGFLQDVKSWIWLPPQVRFYVSDDGNQFSEVGSVSHNVPDDAYGGMVFDFEKPIGKHVRYIRITAPNYGPCPDWHMGAGGQSWLFADEIVVQ